LRIAAIPLKARYDRLIAKDKPPELALTAKRRRMLAASDAMLEAKQAWSEPRAALSHDSCRAAARHRPPTTTRGSIARRAMPRPARRRETNPGSTPGMLLSIWPWTALPPRRYQVAVG
jgi:hypothetical protein